MTFAEGLALPSAIRGSSIDHKYFTFQSHYAIDGQTLSVRREFISHVAGQLCAKEIEGELTEPMECILRSLRAPMTFGRSVPIDNTANPE